MINWYVGQLVLCKRPSAPLVSGDNTHPYMPLWDGTWKPEEPVHGQTYTISKIWETKCGTCFWLKELQEDNMVCFHEELFEPKEVASEEVSSTISMSAT